MGGLRFRVVHVGKVRVPFVKTGIDHYRRKLRPYASLELQAVQEIGSTPSRREGRRGRWHFPAGPETNPHNVWVAVDEGGRRLRSPAFASLLEQWVLHGRSRIGFLVGGPWGLPPGIREQADLAISLSPMTLSHEVALLVLVEQLYRAVAIMNHLPYPK